MKNFLLLNLLMISILACSSTSEDEMQKEEEEEITSVDLSKIEDPCLVDLNNIDLPAALKIAENYSKLDVTTQLFEAVQENMVAVQSLSNVLKVPESATIAKPDDINVYAGEEAFEWEEGGHKYMLKLEEEGWQTYYFETTSKVFGARHSRLEQNDDCSQFHYEENEVTGDNVGETKFSYFCDSFVGATQVQWEYDLYDPASERHRIREFDDGSGDYYYYVGNVITLSMIWEASGNGTYKKFENGEEGANGTFSF